MAAPEPGAPPVIVLGGLGFVGQALCRALLARGHPVRAFARPGPRPELRPLPPQLTRCPGDIERPAEVVDAIGDSELLIDLVQLRSPDAAPDASARAAAGWLRALPRTRVRHVIYFSSGGAIYGAAARQPIAERSPLAPISGYGRAKRIGERYARSACAASGVALTILRPANLYGPGQRLRPGRDVIRTLAEQALRGQPLEVWGGGHAVRDYLYIDDLCDAVLRLLAPPATPQLFNVGSERGVSVNELVEAFEQELGARLAVASRPAPPGMIASNILDCARLRAQTGWRARTPLVRGLRETLDWLRAALS